MSSNPSVFRLHCDAAGTKPLTVLAVLLERERQEKKWGPLGEIRNRSLDRWLTILTEEVGEVANAILERDRLAVRDELVQVAAVALSILDSRAFDEQP